jgi:glycosyltransferase involved in cell wall biosynthesis
LAQRVKWLGHRADVPALLKMADVLVLPSRWEGMPNAVLEAMAAGCAVIASDVDGVADINFPGWRVPPENSDALAQAIVESAGDPNATRFLGKHGRQIVEQQFSQAATVAAYQSLWSKILKATDRNPR